MNMPIPDDAVQGQGHDMALYADDGTLLSWRLYPNPTARVRLVLSHGNGLAMDGYQVFWRVLLADFEVAIFDFRGHGRKAAQCSRHARADKGGARRATTGRPGASSAPHPVRPTRPCR